MLGRIIATGNRWNRQDTTPEQYAEVVLSLLQKIKLHTEELDESSADNYCVRENATKLSVNCKMAKGSVPKCASKCNSHIDGRISSFGRVLQGTSWRRRLSTSCADSQTAASWCSYDRENILIRTASTDGALKKFVPVSLRFRKFYLS